MRSVERGRRSSRGVIVPLTNSGRARSMGGWGDLRRVRRGMGSFGAILSWYKPILELLSIPGYIDDSVSWVIILQAIGAVMSPIDWVMGVAGLACLVYAWWPGRERKRKRKPVHHKVDAGGAQWSFHVSRANGHPHESIVARAGTEPDQEA